MPADTQTARESRLRRQAHRAGLLLCKARSRTVEDPAFGTYMLVDGSTNTVVANGLQSGFGLDLDEIEAALNE